MSYGRNLELALKKRWLPIYKYAKYLGKQKGLALLFWYVSQGTAMFPVSIDVEKNYVFARLSLGSRDTDDNDLALIGKVVALLYDQVGCTV